MPIYLQFFNLVIKKSALEEHQINIWDHIHRNPIIEWEDEYLLNATGSMGEYEFEEWIEKLTKAGLKGPNLNDGPRGKWQDFCIIGTGMGLQLHDCDWLDMDFYAFAGAAVRHIDDTSLDIHHSRYQHPSSRLDAPDDCVVKWKNHQFMITNDDRVMNISPNAEIHLMKIDSNFVLRKKTVPYGTYALIGDGETVTEGTEVANWEPYTNPIFSHGKGTAVFKDCILNTTYTSSEDDITGLPNYEVIEHSADLNPRIEITSEDGTQRHTVEFPVGCFLQKDPAEFSESPFTVRAGDALGRTPMSEMDKLELIEDYEPWQLSEAYKP